METIPRGVAKRILFLLQHEYTTQGYSSAWVNLGCMGTALSTSHVWITGCWHTTEPSPVYSNRVWLATIVLYSTELTGLISYSPTRVSFILRTQKPHRINLMHDIGWWGKYLSFIRLDWTRLTAYGKDRLYIWFYARQIGMHLTMLVNHTRCDATLFEYGCSSRGKVSTHSPSALDED